MEKKPFFINIATLEISQLREGNNDNFTIYATDDEVFQLREMMNEMYNSDIRTFFRAHVPIKPYHEDESNDEFDDGIKQALQMIHDLGDEETQDHIERMGMIDEKD